MINYKPSELKSLEGKTIKEIIEGLKLEVMSDFSTDYDPLTYIDHIRRNKGKLYFINMKDRVVDTMVNIVYMYVPSLKTINSAKLTISELNKMIENK